MPVTTKDLLNRQERRVILRHMLRDTGSSVWPDATLNACLNEALAIVQSRYPWIRSAVLASGYRTYDLPADFVRLQQVMLIPGADADGADFDPYTHGRVLTGYAVAAVAGGRGYASTADTATHMLSLEDAVPDDYAIMVWYEAARQPWGDITAVGSGADVVDHDLCPGELTDGEAELLFYAAARCAALRYAMHYIKADSGDDWPVQYQMALEERDRLMARGVRGTVLRISNGLFA